MLDETSLKSFTLNVETEASSTSAHSSSAVCHDRLPRAIFCRPLAALKTRTSTNELEGASNTFASLVSAVAVLVAMRCSLTLRHSVQVTVGFCAVSSLNVTPLSGYMTDQDQENDALGSLVSCAPPYTCTV